MRTSRLKCDRHQLNPASKILSSELGSFPVPLESTPRQYACTMCSNKVLSGSFSFINAPVQDLRGGNARGAANTGCGLRVCMHSQRVCR